MSKYDELCDALGAVRGEYYQYRQECFLFVGQFVAGLAEYLGAPEGSVSLYARQGSFAGRKVDGPAAAMHLGDDTFWHFGIALDLNEKEGGLTYHTVGFDLRLKKQGDQFLLYVDNGPQLTLPATNGAGDPAVFESMFKFLQGRYRSSFQEFLAGDASRRFGF